MDETVTSPGRTETQLLGMRLMLLMRAIRESGLPIFEREIGYKEIHRHLLLLLGFSGGLTSQEIVALTGYEKAQVSRAIKPLEQDGLVEREKLRARLKLLPPGTLLFERIRAIARDRDRLLTAGMEAGALARFGALTDALAQQAACIYAQERRMSAEAGVLSAGAGAAGQPVWPTGPDGKPVEPPADLITPKLVGLVAYMKRSAMLACQRTHGLSNFQGQVLSLIGLYAPMPMARLIKAMGRDKSQIGRTVAALEEAGLMGRDRPTRRRDIILQPTEAGATVFRAMFEQTTEREDALWSEAIAADRAFYYGMVEALVARARSLAGDATGSR